MASRRLRGGTPRLGGFAAWWPMASYLVAMGVACGDGGGGGCADDADCPGGSCRAGTCFVGEASGPDPECPGGCEDGNPCTEDTCTSDGCVHSPGPDEGACDVEGESGTCVEGTCRPLDDCTTASDCGAPPPCRELTCVDGTCGAQAVADGTDCDDGDATTVGDRCDAGACVGFGPPELCPQLPLGATRQLGFSFNVNNGDFTPGETYEDLFGGWPLPMSLFNATFRVRLDAGKFLSLPFTIPEAADPKAVLRLVWEDNPSGSDGTIVSVSECIGGVDPSQAVDATSCWRQGVLAGGVILIGTDPDEAQCVLEAGRPYVLNVMDYDWSTMQVTCSDLQCNWLVGSSGT